MLKLTRNALHECEVFVDGDGKEIQWRHIKDLHQLPSDGVTTPPFTLHPPLTSTHLRDAGVSTGRHRDVMRAYEQIRDGGISPIDVSSGPSDHSITDETCVVRDLIEVIV